MNFEEIVIIIVEVIDRSMKNNEAKSPSSPHPHDETNKQNTDTDFKRLSPDQSSDSSILTSHCCKQAGNYYRDFPQNE